MAIVPEWLVVGRIVAAFGVRGEVRVASETDFPERRFKRGQRLFVEGVELPFNVSGSKMVKGQYVVKLKGVDDRNRAEELSGHLLRVPGDDLAPLEEGEYYIFQLTGLSVRTDQGEDLGTLAEVLQPGANDVYVVRGGRGEVLLPAIPDVVKDVDLSAGVMTVHLLPGLLAD